MNTRPYSSMALLAMAAAAVTGSLAAKPLKVFILTGQSNMEGHAQTRTFPAVAKDPKTADLYKKMVDADGEPATIEDVWIAYSYGDFGGNPVGKRSGQLTSGFGSQHHVGTGKIGPELTFGITMHEHLGEPILLIKNAWGGKSLMVDFRPPSGGELEDEKAKERAGKYYGHMMDHVKEVLADPKKVYPDYDEKEGYELAGFVWFQGFNDLVGNYPRVDPAQGKKSVKDYSEYSRLLACFIRDVRKDLSAPGLPFVIGVLGTGGESAGDNTDAFRKAMAAPGESDEFKGTVANVFTHEYWPAEIEAVMEKVNAVNKEFADRDREIKQRRKDGGEWKEDAAKLEAEKKAKIEEALSEEELFQYEVGRSNQGFHYHGSAKFFARIGKAFAEALV
ncbi:sialate O-acetylesterase [Haloferula sp. A504]|uniref:sialate O-acetylesterase n=1 Tax=Haloferula sp. A504 TaxID=3373601 RepID=UPI0031CB70D1|nr:sialate O-acetylesterase [Verrucomicrobiaceae bacterium E54]